jgi:hypothetical protein
LVPQLDKYLAIENCVLEDGFDFLWTNVDSGKTLKMTNKMSISESRAERKKGYLRR